MHDLITTPSASTLSMTSREIAEVAGKQHKHVLTDIRNMLNELEIDEPSFRHIYKDSMNRDQIEYTLDEELTLTLTSGYSIIQRNAIIKRWRELEGQQKPMSVMEMVIASAQQHIENDRRLAAVEEKLLLLNSDTGYCTVTAYCKRMGLSLPLAQATKLGRKASKACKELGITIGKIPDERFGTVNSYPVELLDELFAEDGRG